MRDLPNPMKDMYFLADVMEEPEWFQDYFRLGESSRDLQIKTAHCKRFSEPPLLKVKTPYQSTRFLLSFALGGESKAVAGENAHVVNMEVDAEIDADGIASLQIPAELWESLPTNLGFWWTVWQIKDDRQSIARTSEICCFIKHEYLPRLAGSDLGYNDEGYLPIVDLGASNAAGHKS